MHPFPYPEIRFFVSKQVTTLKQFNYTVFFIKCQGIPCFFPWFFYETKTKNSSGHFFIDKMKEIPGIFLFFRSPDFLFFSGNLPIH